MSTDADVTTTRSELLNTIDGEIDRIREEHKRPGWTEWAIYGGFAVAYWALFDFPNKESISYIGVCQILLALYVAYEARGLFLLFHQASHIESVNLIPLTIMRSHLALKNSLPSSP